MVYLGKRKRKLRTSRGDTKLEIQILESFIQHIFLNEGLNIKQLTNFSCNKCYDDAKRASYKGKHHYFGESGNLKVIHK